jgi:hypothetical protein
MDRRAGDWALRENQRSAMHRLTHLDNLYRRSGKGRPVQYWSTDTMSEHKNEELDLQSPFLIVYDALVKNIPVEKNDCAMFYSNMVAFPAIAKPCGCTHCVWLHDAFKYWMGLVDVTETYNTSPGFRDLTFEQFLTAVVVGMKTVADLEASNG